MFIALIHAALQRVLFFLTFCAVWPVVQLYHLTCRIEHQGPLLDYLRSGKPFLLTWWHQDMLFNYAFLTKLARGRTIATMVSQSGDGDLASYVVSKFKVRTLRGSSSRGGKEALRELIALAESDSVIGTLVCDGPRAPARQAKFGIVALARETGLPIMMVRSWGRRQYTFWKSWTKLVVVYPFSNVLMLSAGPLYVPAETGRGELETYRQQVEDRLTQLAEQSEQHFQTP